MMLMEVIFVLAVVLYLLIGPDSFSGGYATLAIVLAVGVAAAIFLAANHLIDGAIDWLKGLSKPRMANRRRMMKASVYKTGAEKKLEALADDALAAYVDQYPEDLLAVEIHCERLAAAGRWADYARDMEYLLTSSREMTREEICNRYNRLAELYQTRLARPDRAREMLQAIIANFPDHYQATLARKRLKVLNAQLEAEEAGKRK